MEFKQQRTALADETFLVCAEILSKGLIHQRREQEIDETCQKISSHAVADYLQLGVTLVDHAYVPEYIHLVLDYTYEEIDRAALTPDERKVLSILRNTMQEIFQEKNMRLFHEVFSHECNYDVRDRIKRMLHGLPEAASLFEF